MRPTNCWEQATAVIVVTNSIDFRFKPHIKKDSVHIHLILSLELNWESNPS